MKLTGLKLKMLAFILSIAACIVAVAGGTVAYFTDSKETNNVYTAGSIHISLTEAAVKLDAAGNLIEDTESPRVVGTAIGPGSPVIDHGYLFPGKTIHKDPTIENTGNSSAWVAFKVIISDGLGNIHDLIGYYGNEDIDIELLLTGGLLDESVHVGTWEGISDVAYNANYAMVQAADPTLGVYEFYFFMLAPLAPGDSVTAFDTMFIDPLFSGQDMEEFRDLKLTVQAFAVQKFGFSSCYAAMTTAFGEHFEGCAVTAP